MLASLGPPRYHDGMSYLVAHIRRVQTPSGLNLVARHNNRVGAYTEDGRVQEGYPHLLAHPERRDLNEYHCGIAQVTGARRLRIEAAALSRKPQSNAATAVEVTISASPDWFEGKTPEAAAAYFTAARDALARRYGAEQIIGWSTHYDETTPHMHVVLVPLVETERGWKYSSSAFVGGRKAFYEFHDAMARALARFGVERGERGGRGETGKPQKHKDNAAWARDLARGEKALAVREAQMEAMWAKREAELSAREKAVNARTAQVESYLASLKARGLLKELQEIHDDARKRGRAQGYDW